MPKPGINVKASNRTDSMLPSDSPSPRKESGWGREVVLFGQHVRLEPLALTHAQDLFDASQAEEVWRYLPTPLPQSLQEMQAWINEALTRPTLGQDIPFAVVDLPTGEAIGSTRLLDLSDANRNVEIGWTWYSRGYWRTPVNTECKYLLLTYAFETLGCIRVQLQTDLRNERSQRAIERIGGVREGVLRRNRLVKDGYQRSSVVYSILEDEWPSVKARLESMLFEASALVPSSNVSPAVLPLSAPGEGAGG
jgi:N-acetyltransferase